MQAAFNLTIWGWPQIVNWKSFQNSVQNRFRIDRFTVIFRTKGFLLGDACVYPNVIRTVWIIRISLCVPSFIFTAEWICTNANKIHLNAASVKSPFRVFTKPAFETKLILPCYFQFYEFLRHKEIRYFMVIFIMNIGFNIPFVRKLVVDFTDSKNRFLIEQVWMPEINRSAEPIRKEKLTSWSPFSLIPWLIKNIASHMTIRFRLLIVAYRNETNRRRSTMTLGYLTLWEKFQFCICVWVGSSVSWVNISDFGFKRAK